MVCKSWERDALLDNLLKLKTGRSLSKVGRVRFCELILVNRINASKISDLAMGMIFNQILVACFLKIVITLKIDS